MGSRAAMGLCGVSIRVCVVLVVLLSVTVGWADDIDIYPADSESSSTGSCDNLPGVAGSLVSPAMPAGVPTASGIVRDIYFALFQPNGHQPWPGNVKKLKLVEYEAEDPNSTRPVSRQLVAQAPLTDPPRAALSAVDGRIRPDALTFWTDPTGEDVLAYNPGLGEVPGRDGRTVTRGGAGQQIAGFLGDTVGAANNEPGARQLFTEHPDYPGALLPLDANLPGLAALSDYLDPDGYLPESEERALLRWIRGQDAFDTDGDGDDTESRAWLMGGLLHSRPLPVNYGSRPGTGYSEDNPDVRLFFGTNDGLFHSVRNTVDSPIDLESGRETWAFLPLELLAMQSALMAGLAESAPITQRYGMDGEAMAHVEDRDGNGNIEPPDGDKVWVYIGQRRGGKGLYAFDMTNPDVPVFKWKITPQTLGFEQLAMTFSTPRIAHLDFDRGVAQPTLVFAGGYHGGWQGSERVGKDADSEADTTGNALFVVDADTGELLWKAVGPGEGAAPENSATVYFSDAMTHSIPSPVTLVDANHNGVTDRAYVGDTGGNVLRIELTEYAQRVPGSSPTDAENWYVRKLASLGGAGTADRRFFHAPDYVLARDSAGDYVGVLITSGNRARPLDEEVDDFAYLLKDRVGVPDGQQHTADSSVLSQENLADITGLCISAEATGCAVADFTHGWRLHLQTPGEKGLSSPLVSNGTVFFTTYIPGTGEQGDGCTSAEGVSHFYAVSLGDGTSRLPPPGLLQPVRRYREIGAGLVGDIVPMGDAVLIPGPGIQEMETVGGRGPLLWPVYWAELDVD